MTVLVTFISMLRWYCQNEVDMLARVDVGNVSQKGKIWKVLQLEVFLLVGFLTELCLCIIKINLGLKLSGKIILYSKNKL